MHLAAGFLILASKIFFLNLSLLNSSIIFNSVIFLTIGEKISMTLYLLSLFSGKK